MRFLFLLLLSTLILAKESPESKTDFELYKLNYQFEQLVNESTKLEQENKELQSRLIILEEQTKHYLEQKKLTKDAIDQRLNDLSGHISSIDADVNYYSIIITILITSAGAIFGITQARSKTKEAMQKMHEELEAYQKKFNELFSTHDGRLTEMGDKFEKKYGIEEEIPQEEMKEIDEEAERLKSKPNDTLSYSDWWNKMLSAHKKKDYFSAIHYLDEALSTTLKESEESEALYAKGVILGLLKREDESIVTFNTLIDRFISNKEPVIQTQVAGALFNKGVKLGALGREDEARAAYEKSISLYGNSKQPNVQAQVVKAMFNKGVRFNVLKQYDQEMDIYDEIIERYKTDDHPGLQEGVARALVNKAARYAATKENEKAIEIFKEVRQRFQDSKVVGLQIQVAKSMLQQGRIFGQMKESAKAIEVFDQIINAYRNSDSMPIQKIIGEAYANKGIRFAADERFDEAIKYYEEATKYNGADEIVYTNLFEAYLITNQEINERIEAQYLEKFEDQSDSFVQYEMIKILHNALHNEQDSEIEKWQEQYKEVSLGGWSFKELDIWKDNLTDQIIKTRIGKYLNIFKGHKNDEDMS
jgi:tetratricopeptide (TPR) repeat protein